MPHPRIICGLTALLALPLLAAAGCGGTQPNVSGVSSSVPAADTTAATAASSSAAPTPTAPAQTTSASANTTAKTTAKTTQAAARTTAAATAAPTAAPVSLPKFDLQEGHRYEGHPVTLFTYPVYDGHSIVQGGTFDGTYCYVAAIDNKTAPETVYITKYDRAGNIAARSKKLQLDHANDITYVKKWDKLLISHCQPAKGVKDDGAYRRYSLVDPTTFAVTETKELPQPFFAMAYDPQRDAFFSARWSGETLDFWNGDLTHRQSVGVDRPLGTSQGIAADGTYLFCARYAPHYLYIYDKDGRQLFDVPLVMGDLGEPEFLSVVDGVLYIGGNDPTWTGGYFAALELKDVTKGQAGGWKK